MRNIGNKTPTTKPEKIQATSEKTSAKKLVQARLPFKIIGSGVLASASSDVTNVDPENADSAATINEASGGSQIETVCKQDVRKRKLSYGEEECASTDRTLVDIKENLSVVTTKKKKTSTSEDVIVLDDSEKEDAEAAIKTTDKDVKRNSLASPKVSSASPKTPMQGNKKRKGAGTPNSAGKSGGVRRRQSPRGNVPKLQIKLPIIGKKKRRKSQRKSITGETGSTSESSAESSDDIEMIAEELNPQKRSKVDTSLEEDIKDQEKELDVALERKEHTENVDTSTEKTQVNQITIISLATQDLPQTDQNKQKVTKSEDKKDKKSTNPGKNKDTLNTRLEDKDTETSDKNIEKPNAATVSEEETVVEKTSLNSSKLLLGKKPLQTLDVFISKEHVATQQEKTNSKQIEAKSKIPKPKKVSEKLKVKPTTTAKNANVSTVDDADDDEDAINSSTSSVEEVNVNVTKEKSKAPESPTPGNVSLLNSSNISVDHRKGGLTPKQQKLMEQRRMAREEKERRLQEQKEERERKAQEEKVQKQREKEEKDLAKKREREEKEEQKRKEREEKEEVKRKEREEKERKRLAEIDAKNEERRKRNEVKEEELRKKDEERKRKEQEKEEAEHKKKKAAEAFTKFFVPKNTRLSKAAETVELASTQEGVEGLSVGENIQTESLAFRPFQIKGDMKLAPLCRKLFKDAAREKLDFFLNVASSTEKSPDISIPRLQQLYLDELKTGKITPGKWRRPTVDTKSEDDDVIIIEDELERAAQTIVEETDRTVEHYRAKLYKFHENRRPPYFGTWRKKTSVITARRPLAQDKKYFDYEVDSDLEWEEEEPGESLDGSDEEKEKESEDEDYEVDNEWFVPHGHLSDEELQNEDESGLGDDNTREAQRAKLKILQQEFAQEMKKKTEKIKPRLIGCIWQDYNGNQPELCPNIIWNSLNLRAMLYTTPPLVEEPLIDSVSEANELSSPTNSTTVAGTAEKLKRILLTEDMLKDLIRLVHGNRHSKVFLINEFIAHIEQTENAIKNGDVRGPLKSVVRDKIDEFALWQVVEAHNNLKSKKKNKKKLCWLVSEEKLKKYNLQSLEVHNKWTYTLPPKFVETNTNSVNEPTLNEEEEAEVTGSTNLEKSSSSKSNSKKISKKKPDVITKFTKVLTTEEKAKQIKQNAVDSKVDKVTRAETMNKRSTPKAKCSSSPVPSTSQQQQSTTPIAKKRVSLLMSVARGQQIPTPTKNALISQFLKKSKDTPDNNETSAVATTKMDIDEVVILD